MTEKIQVVSITFEWSESNQVADNTTVKTFAEAEAIIFSIAAHKDTQGYDKTGFKITWADGETYSGRIDVLSSYTSGKELMKHIEDHCLYFAGERIAYHPNVEEYHNSLKAYEVNEEKQKEYRLFLDTYNLVDVEAIAEAIEEIADVPPIEESNGIYYKLNAEKSGVEIYFNDKPDEEVRNLLKANKFRWSNFNKCWYAKQSEPTLAIAEQLSSNNMQNVSSTPVEAVAYPVVDINDIETYTIDEKLQKAEHDSAWVFRKGERDHNKELQDLFQSYTDQAIELLATTENEYYIYKIKSTLQSFKKNYHAAHVKYLSHKASNPSWTVTGRGGMNVSKYNKGMDRQDKLMLSLADMPKEFESKLMSYKLKIRKDKNNIVKEMVSNTEINVTFKTETKEFMYMKMQEKKRVYSYDGYWICKLWGAFRIFKDGKEIHGMKTAEKLTDAKKYVCMLVQNEMKAV